MISKSSVSQHSDPSTRVFKSFLWFKLFLKTRSLKILLFSHQLKNALLSLLLGKVGILVERILQLGLHPGVHGTLCLSKNRQVS